MAIELTREQYETLQAWPESEDILTLRTKSGWMVFDMDTMSRFASCEVMDDLERLGLVVRTKDEDPVIISVRIREACDDAMAEYERVNLK